MKKLAEKAHVNTGLILGSVLFVFGVIAMLLKGWTIVIVSTTVIYPGLKSIEAIES